MMNRPFCLSLILAVGLLALGCGSPSSSSTTGSTTASTGTPEKGGEKVKIGFLVKSATENWFQMEWKFAQEAADKDGFELIKLEVKDAERVQAELDNLGIKGAKGVVICTPDQQLGPAIVAKAKELNLKLLTVDDRLVGPDGKPLTDVHHLGISAFDIGVKVGEAIAEEMKKRGWKPEEVGACVVTHDQLDTTKQRVLGSIDALKKAGFPEAKIFKVDWGNTQDIPGAKDAAAIILGQHSEIKKWVAFSTNDDGVLGIVRATEDRQIPAEDVIGVGINGTSGVDDLKKDKPTGFFASILLSPKKHGYDTAHMMFEWVSAGKEPPMETWTSGTLITRDNFKEEMAKEGM